MARTTTIITIFLASPNDVSHEREIVAQYVDEWNSIFGRRRSVTFELLRWETSVSAGFGADGQAVVSSQIGNEYDLLLAVLWTRLGTPTPRATSGTVEEIHNALDRRNGGERVEIAIYFKDSPASLRGLDLTQVAAVQQFERDIQERGAFSKLFNSDDALRFELGVLFDRISYQFSSHQSNRALAIQHSDNQQMRPGDPTTTVTQSDSMEVVEADSIESAIEEAGLFDINDDLVAHAGMATAFLAELSTRLDEMTNEISEVSESMNTINRVRPVNADDIKPLISRVAASMDRFSTFLEGGRPGFTENSTLMAEDVRRLVDISRDFNPSFDDLIPLRSMLTQLMDAIASSMGGFSDMLDTIVGLQRTTSVFNRARRRFVQGTRTLISSIESTGFLIKQAVAELDELIYSSRTNNDVNLEPEQTSSTALTTGDMLRELGVAD